MLKPFNVSFSYKIRKGHKTTTLEYCVSAPTAQDAKLSVVRAEKRGCYRFRINSVTPANQ